MWRKRGISVWRERALVCGGRRALVCGGGSEHALLVRANLDIVAQVS